ncbi:hypothetical protein H0H81_004098 [Sphagnurus paluster]|uniref:PHD-type domain-containing protein n=1 Tax=Sphagnurus paluster TaxID=117069 RepID=A0A9P7FWH3_9AGAR|nr:hypothetical protein H0H81_004098 [Sphagnurus paluster]
MSTDAQDAALGLLSLLTPHYTGPTTSRLGSNSNTTAGMGSSIAATTSRVGMAGVGTMTTSGAVGGSTIAPPLVPLKRKQPPSGSSAPHTNGSAGGSVKRRTTSASISKPNFQPQPPSRALAGVERKERGGSVEESRDRGAEEAGGGEQDTASDDPIRCICGSATDDGFSIACDDCSRWCHAACFGIVQGEVPEEWRCWVCAPELHTSRRLVRIVDEDLASGRRMSPGTERKTSQSSSGSHRRTSTHDAKANSASTSTKKRRRPSFLVPNNPVAVASSSSQVPHVQVCDDDPDILVDIDSPWSHAYVPITTDIVPSSSTRTALQRHAQNWRGITALSTTASSSLSIHPVPSSASPLPPTYLARTTQPLRSAALIAPFPSTITPSSTYLGDPLNAYAHLGLPKPFVHLMGPPLDVALDARGAGGEARFVRSGCRPNAVLRPVLCPPRRKRGEAQVNEKGKGRAVEEEREEDPTTLSFAVFALRDLKAHEEVVLGWEWDDGHAVHQLPALLQTPGIFPPKHKAHLRAQMANLLHLLSATFPACACGSAARGCALRQMERFIDGDGEGPSSHPLPPPRPQEPPVPAPVPVPPPRDISEIWRKGGSSRSSAATITVPAPAPPPAPSPAPERVDLGPLVGPEARRGFRTRERVYGAGGLGGVVMCDGEDEDVRLRGITGGSGRTGRGRVDEDVAEEDRDGDDVDMRDEGRDDEVDTEATEDELEFYVAEKGLQPRPQPRHHSPPYPPIHPHPHIHPSRTISTELRPPDPIPDTPTEEYESDVPVAQEEQEQRMPPKMRKRWIHREAEALKAAVGEDGGADVEMHDSTTSATPGSRGEEGNGGAEGKGGVEGKGGEEGEVQANMGNEAIEMEAEANLSDSRQVPPASPNYSINISPQSPTPPQSPLPPTSSGSPSSHPSPLIDQQDQGQEAPEHEPAPVSSGPSLPPSSTLHVVPIITSPRLPPANVLTTPQPEPLPSSRAPSPQPPPPPATSPYAASPSASFARLSLVSPIVSQLGMRGPLQEQRGNVDVDIERVERERKVRERLKDREEGKDEVAEPIPEVVQTGKDMEILPMAEDLEVETEAELIEAEQEMVSGVDQEEHGDVEMAPSSPLTEAPSPLAPGSATEAEFEHVAPSVALQRPSPSPPPGSRPSSPAVPVADSEPPCVPTPSPTTPEPEPSHLQTDSEATLVEPLPSCSPTAPPVARSPTPPPVPATTTPVSLVHAPFPQPLRSPTPPPSVYEPTVIPAVSESAPPPPPAKVKMSLRDYMLRKQKRKEEEAKAGGGPAEAGVGSGSAVASSVEASPVVATVALAPEEPVLGDREAERDREKAETLVNGVHAKSMSSFVASPPSVPPDMTEKVLSPNGVPVGRKDDFARRGLVKDEDVEMTEPPVMFKTAPQEASLPRFEKLPEPALSPTPSSSVTTPAQAILPSLRGSYPRIESIPRRPVIIRPPFRDRLPNAVGPASIASLPPPPARPPPQSGLLPSHLLPRLIAQPMTLQAKTELIDHPIPTRVPTRPRITRLIGPSTESRFAARDAMSEPNPSPRSLFERIGPPRPPSPLRPPRIIKSMPLPASLPQTPQQAHPPPPLPAPQRHRQVSQEEGEISLGEESTPSPQPDRRIVPVMNGNASVSATRASNADADADARSNIYLQLTTESPQFDVSPPRGPRAMGPLYHARPRRLSTPSYRSPSQAGVVPGPAASAPSPVAPTSATQQRAPPTGPRSLRLGNVPPRRGPPIATAMNRSRGGGMRDRDGEGSSTEETFEPRRRRWGSMRGVSMDKMDERDRDRDRGRRWGR